MSPSVFLVFRDAGQGAGGLLHDRPVDEFHRAGTYSLELDTPEDAPELYASIQTGDYRKWTKFVRLSE